MNIKTFGMEKEFFIKKDGQFVLAPTDLPCDECHWLAEARGGPSGDPLVAKYLLLAEVERLKSKAASLGLQLVDSCSEAVPKELLRIARRKYGKSSCKAYFAHGGCYKNDKPRAGLHVHFGNQIDVHGADGKLVQTVQGFINAPRIIWMMDSAFRDIIKAAHRVPGENEVKTWGFEYRSLPSTVDLDMVVSTLLTILAD